MNIELISRDEKALEEYDYRDFLEIKVNGNKVFRVRDGEPEDATLCRDFGDCWKIEGLMKAAFEAGKMGEEFNVTCSEIED
tara:strand:- start:441 stop:683 length:243 start_codon:yes stop_codon:yes gene_type:complete